jgi:hypothetical protein
MCTGTSLALELPEWTPEGMGHHPFSDWKQKFEDLEQF